MDELDGRLTRWLEDEARGEPPAGIAMVVAARVRAPMGPAHPSRVASWRSSASFFVAAAAAVIIVVALGSILPANVPDQTPGPGVPGSSPSGSVGVGPTPTMPTATRHPTPDPNRPTPTRPLDPGLREPTRPPRTPTPTLPPPFTPSGDPAASALERGIRVEMWLSASDVANDEILWGLIRITNESDLVVYHARGCEPASVIADHAELFPRGDRWTGLEAEAKALFLASESPYRDPLREPFRRADLFHREVDCGAEGGVERMEPRRVIDHWVGWRVSFEGVLPLPSGPLLVTASFPHRGSGARPDRGAEPVVIDTQVTVSGPARDYLAPGELVDVLLGDARFTEWLRREPSSGWINPSWSLSEETAELGMFRGGPATDRASLTIDIRTGDVLEWDITD